VLPAIIETTPRVFMSLITLPPYSATYIFPAVSGIVAYGIFIAAYVPNPLVVAATPVPAIVLTTPTGVTMRIKWAAPSATITFPFESIETAVGDAKEAYEPRPLVLALTLLPAKVTTVPTNNSAAHVALNRNMIMACIAY